MTTEHLMIGGDRSFVRAPNGLVLPAAVAEARYVHKRPLAMDFFSGAGGMSLGIMQAGFEVIAAAEYDCTAVITYMANLCRYNECQMVFVEPSDRERMEDRLQRMFKAERKARGLAAQVPTAGSGWISKEPPGTPGVKYVFIGDVRKLTGRQILDTIGLSKGDLDLVTGGPPCQGFSRAGKQDIMDPRNSLVFEFARLILELRPKSMLMEEVPAILNMVTPDGLPVIDALGRILEDGDFTTVDALKKMIAQQTGTVGVLRGKRGEKEQAKWASKAGGAQVDPDQLGLFDEVGA